MLGENGDFFAGYMKMQNAVRESNFLIRRFLFFRLLCICWKAIAARPVAADVIPANVNSLPLPTMFFVKIRIFGGIFRKI